ncbi:MAG: group II intron reverse transcriptase/maturase [Chloroflexi bacterium]|nr:group II intron reverse transcriptase/maturase [Chloroflexota bacterium]
MTDTPMDGKVQRIQAMLYAKASNEPETRFKRLYKYLTRTEWAETAIDRVLRNRGSRTAGIDGQTRRDYLGEDKRMRLAATIVDELLTQTYQPQPVRQVYIKQANGKLRPLGIPTIKDRAVQQMVRMVLEPVYEATFLPCSYGFRPNRCTWDALAEAYHHLLPRCQYYTIIKGDIQDCFGSIHHGTLMHQLQRRITDSRLLTLIWVLLRAGVLEDLQLVETTAGALPGSIVSPLLANVYMHRLDEWFHHRFHALSGSQRHWLRRKGVLAAVRYIRYGDDFIVLMRREDCAVDLKQELAEFITQELKMTLNDEKTTIVHARQGFDFLGVRTFVGPQRSNPAKLLPYQVPAPESVKAYREKVRQLTHPDLDYLPPGERIRTLNWLIMGWANYHRWGNAKETFSELSSWTIKKVHRMLQRYTTVGKRATYKRHFRPISECANLQRWKRYTNWLTPSVELEGGVRMGLLPMAVIPTSDYWKLRGRKIPPAYKLLDDETRWIERETDFYTDVEAIAKAQLGQASRWNTGKYSHIYFHNRKVAFRRDRYTCTACGYKSQRRKGDVNDLEVHHIDPEGGWELDNLQTVCLPCHRRLTAIQQAD